MRLLHSAAGLCVVALALTGCGQGGSEPTESMLTMPASPSADPSADAEPDTDLDPPADGGLSDGGSSDGEQAEGETAGPSFEPSDHCVIVAGGVTTAMLAPLSLRTNSDPEQLLALEQQILDLRDKVPADLHDDFTTLALSVEAPPKGSGTFDEKAFRHAMRPVQDWLGEHCAHS